MLHRRHPRHAPSRLDSRNVRLGASAAGTALLLSAFALTRTDPGLALLGRGLGFLEYYMGVFTLVTLTATVALGLLTSERVFLSPGNRVRAQLAHRGAAVAGIGFLAGHITLMVVLGHAPAAAAVVPVSGIWVGMGAIASDLMIAVLVTGIVRGRFATARLPWVWRAMHAAAYLAWPVSILHGLTAGRPPAPWVAWSYVACLAAVGSALLVRVWATMLRPPAVPEPVQAPAVTAAAAAEPQVEAPVSLDEARKLRRAG